MGSASMRKWVRRARRETLPPGAAARGWYSHRENRDFQPSDAQVRASALHMRLRERKRRGWDRRMARWASEGDGRSYTLTADGELLHIRTREPNCTGKITVNMDRMVYEPVFFHA